VTLFAWSLTWTRAPRRTSSTTRRSASCSRVSMTRTVSRHVVGVAAPLL
jgi:hypothetical protein